MLKQPDISDVQLENLLECTYLFADVAVKAFVEWRSRSSEAPAFGNVPTAAIPIQLLTSPMAA